MLSVYYMKKSVCKIVIYAEKMHQNIKVGYLWEVYFVFFRFSSENIY